MSALPLDTVFHGDDETIPTRRFPAFVIDGDIEQLDDILAQIVRLQREADAIADYLFVAKRAAVDLMLAQAAPGAKRVLAVDGTPYCATVRSYTSVVCACHEQAPWSCVDRDNGAVVLVDRRDEPTIDVKPSIPRNGRFDGSRRP
jgi:hypothetical protein